MPDKKILDMDDLANFELPPLPVRPVRVASEVQNVAAAPVVDDSVLDDVLPELPSHPFDDSLEAVSEEIPLDTLPETVELPPDDEVAAVDEDFDFELPPLRDPEPKPQPVPDEDIFVFEEKAPVKEETTPDEEIFKFEDDEYDPNKSLDELDISGVVMEEMRKPRVSSSVRTPEEESARNMKEDVRTADLERETTVQVLDDLSSEYRAPAKKAESLLDKDKLNDDEKETLKRRLEEDLGRKPGNFSKAASKNMYNKLMEEKKLKIAKKGMVISFIPIVLGLVGAALCYLKLGWGDYTWLPYCAAAGVLGALALLIKSKKSKIFGMLMYGLALVAYVGPGLLLYAFDSSNNAAPDRMEHMIFAVAASVMNIIALVILYKNESVNTYYSTKFKKQ